MLAARQLQHTSRSFLPGTSDSHSNLTVAHQLIVSCLWILTLHESMAAKIVNLVSSVMSKSLETNKRISFSALLRMFSVSPAVHWFESSTSSSIEPRGGVSQLRSSRMVDLSCRPGKSDV